MSIEVLVAATVLPRRPLPLSLLSLILRHFHQIRCRLMWRHRPRHRLQQNQGRNPSCRTTGRIVRLVLYSALREGLASTSGELSGEQEEHALRPSKGDGIYDEHTF